MSVVTAGWPPRLSLRARVTWLVVAVSALVQVVLALGVFIYFRSVIDGFFDERLAGRTRLALTDVEAAPDPTDQRTLQAATERTLRMVMFTSLVLVVRDERGVVLGTSSEEIDHRDLPTPPPFDAWPPRSQVVSMVGMGTDPALRQSTRVMTAPFTARDGRRLLLSAAVSNAASESMTGFLGRAVVVASGLGLVATGIASWMVTGVALSPLSQIGALARRFGLDAAGTPLSPSRVEETVPELAQLSGELENARERIRASLAANERFIVNVSHEIKTPVAVLRAQAQALRSQPVCPAALAFARSVDEEATRLGSMVDSFLTLASVRSGQTLSTMSPVHVHDLVLDAVRRSASAARQGSVTLHPRLGERADDVTVSGNADLLSAMVDNLVRNAVRFSPPGGAVEVSVEHRLDRVTVAVTDQGPGVPAELLPRLFDRFSQASSEVGQGRGHGLGLSIAQGIAELHGGRITVENLSPRGCRFQVHLPRTGSVTFPLPAGEGSRARPAGPRQGSADGGPDRPLTLADDERAAGSAGVDR